MALPRGLLRINCINIIFLVIFFYKHTLVPSYCVLVLFRVIRLNRLRLDDDGSIAASQRTALGRDGASDVARRQSQRHRYSRGYRHRQVLNRLHKALFLAFG